MLVLYWRRSVVRLPLCCDPNDRSVPMKNLTFRDVRVTPSLKKEIASWFEHELVGDKKSVVHKIHASSDDDGIKYISVDGVIQTKLGTQIGDFHRAVYDDIDGIKVNHDGFDIYESFQGEGVGSDFINKCFTSFKNAGVDRVCVYASDYMGGFAWARMGFRVRNDTTRHSIIKWMLNRVHNIIQNSDLSQNKKRQAISDMNKLLTRSEKGEDVQPCHVAEIGEEYAKWNTNNGPILWPGKKALMSYGAWDGVFYFDGRQQ